MGAADQDLEPITDKKIVERYFQYALEFRETISCRNESGDLRFEATLRALNAATLGITLEVSTDSFVSLTPERCQQLNQARLRLSFAVNSVLYFAHARVEGRKMRALDLQIDLPVYKLQRREAMRIKILTEHNSRIHVDGKAYIPHDLSASGLSFVVMPDEEALFPIRRMIQACRLVFLGIDVPVNLEVMSVSRLRKDNERLIKVGFRFMGLSPIVEQKLAREAYLHTHKIWARWI